MTMDYGHWTKTMKGFIILPRTGGEHSELKESLRTLIFDKNE